MRYRTVLAAAAAFAVSAAGAETFLWKNTRSTDWYGYGSPGSWRIGTSIDSPVSTEAVPGPSDRLCLYDGSSDTYDTYWYMDLGGADHEVLGLVNGNGEWGPVNIHIKNGSLTVTENFTNTQACVYLDSAGALTIGEGSHSRFGYQGMSDKWYVNDGGTLSILGSVTVDTCHMYNYEGGVFTFDPVEFKASGTFAASNGKGASLNNYGTLNLPGGLEFGGTGSERNGFFRLVQYGGTMNLGGALTASATKARFAFVLAGGTLNVSEDSSFISGNATYPLVASMTNGASASVNVAAGRTFDASGMTFEADTELVKTGAGTLTLDAVPDVLSVEEGTVSFVKGIALGSSLSLSPGSVLHLGAPGISAHAIDGIDGATVTAASSLIEGGACLVFASDDPELVRKVAARLAESGAVGLTVTDGGILREIAHEPAIFAWANEGLVDYSDDFRGGTYTWYPFCAASSWKIGISRADNSSAIIPDESDDVFISDAYNPLFAMDMGGQHRKVRSLIRNLGDDGKYPCQSGFRQFNVRNGTLEFTGSFTNVRVSVDAKATGRFILSETSTARLGHDGAENRFIAEDGGEIGIYGSITIHRAIFEVDAGGRMVFDPVSLEYDTAKSKSGTSDFIRNCGILKLPSGLVLSARGWSGIANTAFTFEQNGGTLELGGSVVRESGCHFNCVFRLNGGTVSVLDDATVSGFDVCEMTAGSEAVVCVEAGKTLDLSEMVFAAGTKLLKTGAGKVVFGESVPGAMTVSEGTVGYLREVDVGSSLSLAPGTGIVVSRNGMRASAINGLEEASVAVDFTDGYRSCLAFSSDDSALLAAVLAKLEQSLAESAEGAFVVSGGAVVYEKPHAQGVFSWRDEGTGRNVGNTELCETNKYGGALFDWRHFCNADSWAVGTDKNGANGDGLIPGPGDDMYVSSAYYPIFGMDLGGASRSLRNLELMLDGEGAYPNQYGFRGFFIRNGTLEFTGSFTNVRAVIKAKAGGRFVLGETSSSRLGYNGAQNIMYADNGGRIDLLGAMDVHHIQFTVAEGGKGVIAPREFTVCPKNGCRLYIKNHGTLSFPKGITFMSGGWEGISGSLDIEHRGGRLELGGSMVCTDEFHLPVNFSIAGGTIDVSGRVGFSGLSSLTVEDAAVLDINVPEGAVLNLSPATFGEDTIVNKYGEGGLIFGTSRPAVYNRHDSCPGFFLMVR